MSEYRSWRAAYQAMCPPPGPRDEFVVVLVNGKRVNFWPVTDYDKLRTLATRLVDEHQCQMKVLPMTGSELMNFLGLEPGAPQPMETLDPELRQQAIVNCMDSLRESAEPREREWALDLLQKLGVLHV